ncbi:MAG: hypothetical protein IJC87_03370 [Clostridia bacterium]|nr:hypothetical protein [Clostridia bacterium]
MSNYYVVKEPDAGDIFGSIMAFLVVLFIIFAFAAMIGFYILLIFLGIGVLIGMGYAIYAYIKGFINACKTISGVHGRNGLTSLLLRWFVLFKNASVFVIKDTFAIAKNSLVKAGAYRFLSFKKWMWLIVAPTVIVCGLSMVIVVALLQVALVLSIAYFILVCLAVIAAIYLLVSTVYAIIKVGAGTFDALGNYNPFSATDFSKYFTFSDIGRFSGEYFRNIFSAIRELWGESISLMTYNFSSAKGYPVINIFRYFFFVSPLMIFVMACIFIALAFIILSVVYVPLLLAELVWALIIKVFRIR